MKNCYLFFVFSIVIINQSFSQNPTPNAGFENWTQVGNHYDPDNWNTLNPSTSVVGVLSATRATGADVHTGNYAIKLTTKLVFNLTANGISSTGTIITTPPYGVIGGIAINSRPDSIAGWYKCSPEPGDTGFAQMLLLDNNGDTVGFTRWWAPSSPTTTYARFSQAIDYYNSSIPTISQWILSSSKGFNQIVNSAIIFDDLELITNPVGLPENENTSMISLFPHISPGLFSINNFTGKRVQICIYDLQNRLVYNREITETSGQVDLSGKACGLYFYNVKTRNNQVIHTGKLLIN